MERIHYANKRILLTIAALFAVGIITTMIPVSTLILHNIPAASYLIIILLWARTIRRRILEKNVRTRIIAACFFMVLLFFLRMCKFSFFPDLDLVNEYLWYAYYIPMTAIPLFMFLAALRVEPVRHDRLTDNVEKFLLVCEIILCLVIITNAFHGQVFAITVHPDKEFTHEWFYYLTLAWMILLGIGTLVMLFRKCSLSAVRRLWYIPAICIALGLALLIWYLINGGAPKIDGHKLFHLQEAYCLPFIAGFESVIQIGMIPANTGYEKLFDLSRINVCISDREGRMIIASKNWDPAIEDEDHRICVAPISGGSISWVEDLSALNRLNRELTEVTEELHDENELIRQENNIRAERVSFETRNRLYNRISSALREKAKQVDAILSADRKDESAFRQDLIFASVLGAYIKRMGNLMLLADANETIAARELGMAISESMEYTGLNGCMCDLTEREGLSLPSEQALNCYSLFEYVLEDAWDSLSSLVVRLGSSSGRFEMRIAMEAENCGIAGTRKAEEVTAAGGELSVGYEDETWYISLFFNGEPGGIPLKRREGSL